MDRESVAGGRTGFIRRREGVLWTRPHSGSGSIVRLRAAAAAADRRGVEEIDCMM